MLKYIIKRIIGVIPTLIFVTTFVLWLFVNSWGGIC